MAVFQEFKCDKCHKVIRANGLGYDRLISGWIGFCSCPKCRSFYYFQIPYSFIELVNTDDERSMKALHRATVAINSCIKCGYRNLKPWTKKCRCPYCAGKLQEMSGIICVD